jgi:hypothetical protein
MPAWFAILAKVLALLGQLVPMVETQFGSAPGSGADKKAAVMGMVTDELRGPLAPKLRDIPGDHQATLLQIVSDQIDNMVAVAKHPAFRPAAPTLTQDETSDAPEGGGSAPGPEVAG